MDGAVRLAAFQRSGVNPGPACFIEGSRPPIARTRVGTTLRARGHLYGILVETGYGTPRDLTSSAPAATCVTRETTYVLVTSGSRAIEITQRAPVTVIKPRETR